jgi:diguanylate cyclase (GGDEF)-like protein
LGVFLLLLLFFSEFGIGAAFLLSLWRSKLFKRWKRGYKLSFMVSVLVGFSITVALGISIWSVYQTEQTSFTERTLELNKINSERLAATTDSLFKSMRQTLSITAGKLGKRLPNTDIQFHLDLLKASTSNFNSTLYVDKKGILVSTSLAYEFVRKEMTSEAVKQAILLREPLISEPYRGITGRLLVLVSHPVFNVQGEYLGLVAGSIYLQEKNEIRDILDKKGQSLDASYTYVVSRNGELLYHPDSSLIGRRIELNPKVMAIIKGQADGEQLLTDSKGISILAGYAFVKENGWGIITQTPAKEVLDLTHKVMKKIILLALPFVLLLLLLAWWVSTMVAKPLTLLARYARAFSQGENHVMEFPQIKHWNYEANELNKTIKKAVGALQERVEHFTLESQTDVLTGLMNRRSIDNYLEIWMEQGVHFSILLLDLDYFKAVNDLYGHLMGDEVLKFLARTMLNELRPEDVCCRFGGEEFVILLPRMNKEVAYKIAERIRMRMEFSANPTGTPVTLSLGIAAYPENATDPTALFEKVDRALYRAKRNGRNQTVIYREDM